MAYEHNEEPDADVATRTGEFAMLIYSIGMFIYLHHVYIGPNTINVVAVIAGTILPHLAGRDRRLMAYKGDVDEDAELTRIRNTVREWRAEAVRRGRPLRLPVMPFLLRNIWTGALVLFSVLTFATFFVSTVLQVGLFFFLKFQILIQMVGYHSHQSRWNLLGGGDVGAIRDHYGGGSCIYIFGCGL